MMYFYILLAVLMLIKVMFDFAIQSSWWVIALDIIAVVCWTACSMITLKRDTVNESVIMYMNDEFKVDTISFSKDGKLSEIEVKDK